MANDVVMSKRVMIAVPTAEMARQAVFYDYYNLMTKPEGTACTFAHGQSPASNRNTMIQTALEHDCTHIMFLDDDVTFEPDTLLRLMAHDVDIVGGYYLMRQYPHRGLLFDYAEPDGKSRYYEPKDGEQGLVEVVATGLGCILFNLDVFKKLEKPWVRLGEIEPDGWCDDIGLFKRIREAGFKAYVDTSIVVGHLATMIVTPRHKEGAWHVEINSFARESIQFPMVRLMNGKNGK